MRILLDTNILIHREASNIINQDIGQLFNWLDRLNHKKCIHPLTIKELEKHQDSKTVKSFKIKLSSYNILKTIAPLHPDIQKIIDSEDKTDNEIIDSHLLNELVSNRVDLLITEDKNIHLKAANLGVDNNVYTIDRFLEKAINENPELVDYNILSVKKEYFGNIDLQDEFFDSFRDDYSDFDKWFRKKSDDEAYICMYGEDLAAFLYVKVEGTDENYSDIIPPLKPKKRLKIGTFKVAINGLRLGERFLKIIFDNALHQNVEEIYLTIFDKRPGQKSLINLVKQFGFNNIGKKITPTGEELVYVRDFSRKADRNNPKHTFPFLPKDSNVYFVSIYPEYHTELFPDSILRNESPLKFIENRPHRNAINKVYISHAIERPLKQGDVLLFYRTGGYHKGVATTVAIVDSIIDKIKDEQGLIDVCRKRTVLSINELKGFWNRFQKLKPFVIEILYSYSLPRKPNLKRLIELGVIKGVDKMPRGFGKISLQDLENVLKDTGSDESISSN